METKVRNSKPRWVDEKSYPFRDHFIDLASGKMHYVDEGEGEVLLFIHGTPSWSFLYRKYIKEFSRNYRCIAIDHIGFGLSEKPPHFRGTPQDHERNLAEFIDKLQLENITLIVHDFGGPIGLSYATANSEKIKKIIMFNTWLWETASNKEVVKIGKILNSWVGRFLYLTLNFSPKILMKKAFFNKKILSKTIHQHYIRPFGKRNDRTSLLNIGKSLLGASDWYQEHWEKLDGLVSKPWLIIWGTRDPFLTISFLEKWMQRIPTARVVKLESGHFVQEEEPDISLVEMKTFISGN